jgi:hypothetical protein
MANGYTPVDNPPGAAPFPLGQPVPAVPRGHSAHRAAAPPRPPTASRRTPKVAKVTKGQGMSRFPRRPR